MLAADLPALVRANALLTEMGPNSTVITTELTPPSPTSIAVKNAFSAKHLLIAGGVGFVGLLGYLLLFPKKKKATPSAPVSGWFRRRR